MNASNSPIEASLKRIRAHFPALSRRHENGLYCYLDGPGGTQVPAYTIERMAAYLRTCNANHEGNFATSRESDELLRQAHERAADFLGAGADEVVLGQNMTTLTFATSRAIGRTLGPGDEIVVTHLDHDANVAPWLALEEERGAVIRWVDVDTTDCTLDMASYERALGPKTKIVAVGLASNAVGTINPIPRIVEMAHAVGAWTYVDAVHAAPHMPIDVKALDTDFLVCSPYKFFGPHLGLLYGKRERLEQIRTYKVRPAPDAGPGKWETGTLPGESIAGLLGTFEYLEWLGREVAGAGPQRSDAFAVAMSTVRAWEKQLGLHLLDTLQAVPGLHLRGITDPKRFDERVPTFAFTLDGYSPAQVAEQLGDRGIAVWDGDYYAYELIRTLGLAESGGMVRVGLAHYNTPEEIDRLGRALSDIASAAPERG